ncbi:MAG: hypothetical protein IV100_18940 [Myxococcales bacterium]|nr:hypothetical protein [Myxococcales bacterium]
MDLFWASASLSRPAQNTTVSEIFPVLTYVLDRGDLGSVASPVDALRALTPGARALAVPSGSAATPKQDGGLLRLTFEVWLPQDVDAETLRMRAVQAGVTGLVEVKLSEE